MTKKLSEYGQWALITGGSQGIGYGFAERCAADGLNVALVARREEILNESAQKLRDQYGVEVRTLALDCTKPEAFDQIAEFVSDVEINVLVNNVAFSFPGEFVEFKMSSIEKCINVNVVLTTKMTRHFGQKMKQNGKGALINVSSLTGEVAMPYFALYSATKACISTLTQSIWFEMKDYGVDVLVIKPDQTATEGFLAMNPDVMKEFGLQTVEECVEESLASLGKEPACMTQPMTRDHIQKTRAMPLHDAIIQNGTNMKKLFSQQLESV